MPGFGDRAGKTKSGIGRGGACLTKRGEACGLSEEPAWGDVALPSRSAMSASASNRGGMVTGDGMGRDEGFK